MNKTIHGESFGLFVKRRGFILIVLVILLGGLLPFYVRQGSAVSYAPGVKSGDTVTYGNVTAFWNSVPSGTPPIPFIDELLNVRSIQVAVQSVSGSNITMAQTFAYTNGTADRTIRIQGSVTTGSGNLTFWILSGGLTAGSAIYNTPGAPTLNNTDTVLFAGALRQVNRLVLSPPVPSGNSVSLELAWDQATGVLVSFLENASLSSPTGHSTGQASARLTSTNLWTASATADFAIVAEPSSLTINSGSAAASYILVIGVNRFNGAISLSSVVSPVGISATLSRSSVSLSPGGNASSVLTVAALNSTSSGSYTVTVSGMSGSISHSTILTVKVKPPVSSGDFTISESPTRQLIPVASEKQTVITLSSLNGFSGDVNLVATLPAAVSCWFSGTLTNVATVFVPANGYAYQYPTCTGGPAGNYAVTISATSGSLSHSVILVVTIMDFSISAPSVSFLSGSSTTGAVTLTSLLGLSGPVSLSVSAQSSLTASCPSTVDLSSGGTTIATCLYSSNSPGTYSVTITGTFVCTDCYYNGRDSRSVTIIAAVQAGRDFTLSANPSGLIVLPGSAASSTITVASIDGFSGTISLTSSISPSGPTVSLSANTILLTAVTTGISTLTIATTTTTNPGRYFASVMGTNGTVTRSIIVTIEVASADFSLLANPNTLTLQPGMARASTVQVVANLTFTGTVTLSATSTPSGLSASLNPTSVIPSVGGATSTLTVSAGTDTVAGTYIVTITGTSGSLSRSTTVSVSVAVQPPDFTMAATAFPAGIPAGSNGTSTITLISVNGFSGTVSLFAVITTTSTGYPTAILKPANVTLTGGPVTSQLIITTTINTTPGVYTITLTGNAPTISHSISMAVQVFGPRDFALAASPSFLDIPQGSTGASQVSLSSLNGFAGTVSMSVAVLPSGTNSTLSGPSATLSSNTISLFAGGTAITTLAVSTTGSTIPGFYTFLVTGTNGSLTHSVSVGVQVRGPPDQPPIASFTFTPASPTAGQTVSFDGSSSRDPDGFVTSWSWNFGDNSFTSFGSFTSHQYSIPGNYSVTLTVNDNAGLTGTVSKIVQVRPQPQHDVAIVSINIDQRVAVSTQTVAIQAQLENDGSSNETVTLTGYYDGHVIQTINGLFLQACPSTSTFPRFCSPYFYTTILWDTTGVQAGNFTISATVFLTNGELDPTPADNSATGGIVTILPPPSLTVTPTSGSIGTKVLVQGSGFQVPQPSQFVGPIGYIDVSFDDNFLGFTISQNGSFNFTLDVPQAQTGPHLVKAVDQFAGARASASFTVKQSLNFAITIDTGAIYYPGDNVVLYVVTSLNGSPVDNSNGQLQMLLFKPDGTNITLSGVPIATGFYKATYNIPTTGSIGTYAIVAKAHQTGTLDATALRSFEVKATGIGASRPAIGTGLAVTLNVGTVYFPGDKATIFLFVTQNGTPGSPSDIQLTVEVVKPDGSTEKLTATKIATGMYTASTTVPSTNSIGTYAVIATGHSASAGDSLAHGSFEVKPTWVAANGPAIETGLAIAGLAGVAGIAWRKGFFKKDDENPLDWKTAAERS